MEDVLPAATMPTRATRAGARLLRETAGLAIAALLLAVLLRGLLLQVFFIPSESMEPTLTTGDRVVVLKTATIDRGDVIVFRPPGAATVEHYIKRAIGLSGDLVEINGGRVLVNGVMLQEPYAQVGPDGPGHCNDTEMAPRTVRAGELFFLGDNRGNSCDSREVGTVPTTDIVGEAVAVVWPLTRIQADLGAGYDLP